MRRVFLALVVVMASAGCPSLGTLFSDRGDLEIVYDLPYIDDDSGTHRLDLYSPVGAADDVPVVVFIHGGYWAEQDKQYFESTTGLYGNVGVALTRHGVRVANCNYRLHPEVKIPGMLDDVAAATAFIRAKFPSAPVVLMGHSAGAHLASAAAVLEGGPKVEVDALVLVSGVYDIEQAVRFDSPDNRAKYLFPLFGDTPEEQAKASTLSALLTTSIPVLVAAGSVDLGGVRADFRSIRDARSDVVGGGFAVEVQGAEHADTALQFAGEQDRVTPAIVEMFKAIGLL